MDRNNKKRAPQPPRDETSMEGVSKKAEKAMRNKGVPEEVAQTTLQVSDAAALHRDELAEKKRTMKAMDLEATRKEQRGENLAMTSVNGPHSPQGRARGGLGGGCGAMFGETSHIAPGAEDVPGPSASSPSGEDDEAVPQDSSPQYATTARLVEEVVAVAEIADKEEGNGEQEKKAACGMPSGKTLFVLVVVLILSIGVAVGLAVGLRGSSGDDDPGASVTTAEPGSAGPNVATEPPVVAPTFPPAEPCSADSDCPAGVCARETVGELNSELICCPSGLSVTVSSVTYCAGLQPGSPCTSNNFCEMGLCIENTCRAQANSVNESCEENVDCRNLVCAFDTYGDLNRKNICCPSGTTVTIAGADYCADQGPGRPCATASNQICASGVCIDGTCRAEANGPGETCSEDRHCKNQICAFDTYGTIDRKQICCPGGKSVTTGGETYCAGLDPGQACASNEFCAPPGICIDGTCRAEANNATDTCEEDADCRNDVCALDVYGAANRRKICCPGRTSVTVGEETYCGGLEQGSPCASNSFCANGNCIFGTCEEQRLERGALCEHNKHCKVTVCARRSYLDLVAETICCESGAKATVDSIDYCTHQPNNSSCGSGPMCASGVCANGTCVEGGSNSSLGGSPAGATCQNNHECDDGACGYDVFDELTRKRVCCPSGEIESAYLGETGLYCTEQPDGRPCGSNTMCASGLCIGGRCQAEANDANQVCSEDADCKNQVCAFDVFDKATRKKICCPTAKVSNLYLDEWDYFCADQPAGKPCGTSNSFCQSAHCVQGFCQEEANDVGETCVEEADCKNSVCAFDVFDEATRKLICCPTGGVIQAYLSSWESYCTGQAEGLPCSSNGMCASNICIGGVCRTERNNINEVCAENADCENRECAYDVYDEVTRKFVCCPTATIASHVLDSKYADFCTAQPDGRPCASNYMCSSGVCIGGKCQAERNDVNEACSENADCKNRVCAYDVYNVTTRKLTCCPSGSLTSAVLDSKISNFCAGQEDGNACGTDAMCESLVCIDGVCG